MFTLSSSQYVITFVSTLSYGRHFRNETTPYKQINFIPVSSTTSPSLPPSLPPPCACLLFFYPSSLLLIGKISNKTLEIIIQQEQNHEEHTSSNSITSLSCYAIMSTFIPRRHRSPS